MIDPSGGTDLLNSKTDAEQLAYIITYGQLFPNPAGLFRASRRLHNRSVCTSEFGDNKIIAQGDQDHLYFDKAGHGIAYLSAHGITTQGQTGDKGVFQQPCTRKNECDGRFTLDARVREAAATRERAPEPDIAGTVAASRRARGRWQCAWSRTNPRSAAQVARASVSA